MADKTETTKELKAELDKAWEWIRIQGKINRELLDYILERRNGKRKD